MKISYGNDDKKLETKVGNSCVIFGVEFVNDETSVKRKSEV